MEKQEIWNDPTIRKPILIGRNTLMYVQIFRPNKSDMSLDILFDQLGYAPGVTGQIAEQGAKEFIVQLNNWWTPRFLKCLRDEIDKTLKESEEKYKEI